MRMLRFSFVAALVVLSLPLEGRAQLFELELIPNPASALEPVEAVVGFPWFADSQTFEIETAVTGTLVSIEIAVTGQPSGGPLLLVSIQAIGRLAPGEYEVVANYRVDNVLVDSEAARLLVKPVREIPLLESPYLLGLLALLLLSGARMKWTGTFSSARTNWTGTP